MPRDKAPTEPKPFFWITLGRQAPRREPPPPHDRFNGWSGRLELEIEVVSEYLYVGSGNFELFNLNGREQAYYTFTRRNGQLIIPGTGIKGAVRSIVEAISNSCVRQVAKGERAPGHEACRDANTLCPACRLFGTTGYGGRVHFSDAVPLREVGTQKIKISDLWPPRQAKGRKFYYARSFQPLDMQPEKNHRFIEGVPKGSKFAATLYFENLSTAEMGLLVRAIGLDFSRQDPSRVVYAFPIKLGGAKPRCLGAAYLRPRQLYLIPEGPDLFSALLTGGKPSPASDNIKVWLKDESLLDRQAWEAFCREAKRKDEPCPREMYCTMNEQIQLAERIANGLPEVSRNEWMRWMELATRYGLDRAIRHAERLSTDVTMRPAVQRANRLIAQSVKTHLAALKNLKKDDQLRVLGYVSWWLRVNTLRGSLPTKG